MDQTRSTFRGAATHTLVALALVAVGCGSGASEEDGSAPTKASLAGGHWEAPLPPTPKERSGYQELRLVPLGSAVLVIAGVNFEQRDLKALAFDTGSRTWSGPQSSRFNWRYGFSAVAASGQVLIWGCGCGPTGPGFNKSDGISYDPEASRWSDLPAAPISSRSAHTAVWTGDEMIVWGGIQGAKDPVSRAKRDGAAYDPDRESWKAISEAPIPPRFNHVAVWTGDRMIVWGGGGSDSTHPKNHLRDGAEYDPATDTWTAIPEAPIPSGFGREHEGSHAAWAGDRMVVWNGLDAAAYDPASGSWTRLPRPPDTTENRNFGYGEVLWTGSEVIVWNQSAGASYAMGDPSWRLLPAAPQSGRASGKYKGNQIYAGDAVWTGAGMFVLRPNGTRIQSSGGAIYLPG